MIIHHWYRIQQWFMRYIHLQLFILFIVLPFLIGWGLPISILSPISTLIFSPFLILFLFLSSVVFFLELLYLPNSWLIKFLEYLGNFWFTILGWEQTSWLKGFIKPTPSLLLLIPLSALVLIHYKQTHHPMRNIISLSSLFMITYIALSYMHPPIKTMHTIPCRNKEVTLICHNNHIIFIDPGTIAANASALSWISYTLVPYLIESTGQLFIDHVIILQPSARIFEALALLCTKIKIKKLYLPWWQNKLPKNAWYHFVALQKIAKETGCKIVRIDKKTVTITIDKANFIHLKPQTNHLRYTTITYPAIHAQGTIDKQLFSLYPNQENRKKVKLT